MFFICFFYDKFYVYMSEIFMWKNYKNCMEIVFKFYFYENLSMCRYKFGFYRCFVRGIVCVIKLVFEVLYLKLMCYGFGF